MKTVISILMCSATLLGLAVPAHAQEQTVEGAQKFLQVLASQGHLTLSRRSEGHSWDIFTWVDDTKTDGRIYSKSMSELKVASVTSAARCRTAFNVNYFDYEVTYSGSTMMPPRMTSDGPQNITINWEKVAAAVREGNSIVLQGNDYRTDMSFDGYTQYRINLPTEDLAKRVEYALEFIRMSCDPAAATGF